MTERITLSLAPDGRPQIDEDNTSLAVLCLFASYLAAIVEARRFGLDDDEDENETDLPPGAAE